MKKRIFTAITVGICSLVMMFSLAHADKETFIWGASTGQVDGYRIYSGEATSGPYQNMLGEVNGTTLTQTLIMDEALEYFLIVRAFNRYGESGNSNELHWLYALPGAPGNFDTVRDYARAILDKTGAKNMQVNLVFEQ